MANASVARSRLSLTCFGLLAYVLFNLSPVFADGAPSTDITWPRETLLHCALDETVNDATTLQLLRREVQRNPHDTELWAALIHMLKGSGNDDKADQASRTALSINPNDPRLLIARAEALDPSSALDVLNELSKIPGQKDEASRLIELVSLGLRIPWPHGWEYADTYCQWADRLLYTHEVERASAVLDEGISRSIDKSPSSTKELWGRKAMVLALQKRFTEAMAIQRNEGFPQIEIAATYAGMADVLLQMNQPKLAIDSFGGQPPHATAVREVWNGASAGPHEKELRRVLAWAQATVGNFNQGITLLTAHPDVYDQMLLIRIYVEAGKSGDAKENGDELVNAAVKYATTPRAATIGPYLPNCNSAASLSQYYIWAVRWMMEHHPTEVSAITGLYGSPSHPMQKPLPFAVEIPPLSQLVPKLRGELVAALSSGESRRIADARRLLANALVAGGHYAEAAHVIAPLAVVAISKFSFDQGVLNFDAVHWSILNRRADADAVFVQHPEVLRSADELLEIPNWRYWNEAHIDDGLDSDERVKKLCALGPGVMADVLEDFRPDTISRSDKTEDVRVIDSIGCIKDAPVLIDAMGSNLDDATLAAIENCLEKFTGQRPQYPDKISLKRFWIIWWDNNAEAIVPK
jgi:hypothetical protein